VAGAGCPGAVRFLSSIRRRPAEDRLPSGITSAGADQSIPLSVPEETPAFRGREAEFAIETIRRWWMEMGRPTCGAAEELLIEVRPWYWTGHGPH